MASEHCSYHYDKYSCQHYEYSRQISIKNKPGDESSISVNSSLHGMHLAKKDTCKKHIHDHAKMNMDMLGHISRQMLDTFILKLSR